MSAEAQRPERETPYLSGYNPESSEDEVDLYCPECDMTVSVVWSDLEKGTELDCDACGFKWINAGGAPI